MPREDYLELCAGIDPLLSLSERLIRKIELFVSFYDTASTKVAQLFLNDIQEAYSIYFQRYPSVQRIYYRNSLKDVEFVNFCRTLQKSQGYSFAYLIYLPIQRAAEYEEVVGRLLDNTPTNCKEYEDLAVSKRFLSDMLSTVVDTRSGEVETRHSDNGKLNRKVITHRRKSAPPSTTNSTTSLNSKSYQLTLKKNADQIKPENSKRQLVLEQGEVLVSSNCSQNAQGMQTKERHIGLFNDMLIVAKADKNRLRIKQQIPLNFIWIGESINEVCDSSLCKRYLSFVIGWPTINFVITFKYPQIREKWWAHITDHMDIARHAEEHETAEIRVTNRSLSQRFPGVESSDTEDPEQYSLWVVDKAEEKVVYPLIGHERPFAIKRHYEQRSSGIVDVNQEIEFIMKSHRESRSKLIGNGEQQLKKRKWKSLIRQPWNIFGREDRSFDSYQSPNSKKERSRSKSRDRKCGKLFGQPLTVVNEGGILNPVIYSLLHELSKRTETEGIVRKCGNVGECKRLVGCLDKGRIVDWEQETNTHILVTVLKEYLKQLPSCVVPTEERGQWEEANKEPCLEKKLYKLKILVDDLPIGHAVLLKHLICFFHHVCNNSNINQMITKNVATAIAPSLSRSEFDLATMEEIEKMLDWNAVVETLIEYSTDIFGSSVVNLLDENSCNINIHVTTPDTSRREESLVRQQTDEASLDSLDLETNRPAPVSPSSLSRDSGLSTCESMACGVDDEQKIAPIKPARRSRKPEKLSQKEDSGFSDDKPHLQRSDALDLESPTEIMIVQPFNRSNPKTKSPPPKILLKRGMTCSGADLALHRRNTAKLTTVDLNFDESTSTRPKKPPTYDEAIKRQKVLEEEQDRLRVEQKRRSDRARALKAQSDAIYEKEMRERKSRSVSRSASNASSSSNSSLKTKSRKFREISREHSKSDVQSKSCRSGRGVNRSKSDSCRWSECQLRMIIQQKYYEKLLSEQQAEPLKRSMKDRPWHAELSKKYGDEEKAVIEQKRYTQQKMSNDYNNNSNTNKNRKTWIRPVHPSNEYTDKKITKVQKTVDRTAVAPAPPINNKPINETINNNYRDEVQEADENVNRTFSMPSVSQLRRVWETESTNPNAQKSFL
ncbi:DgyrCDS6507 [Dimorphilus gyrociliatus]|uniref:DgyrCDS6507 n=1 Tax=Dimorphilus gyrociliatus TaxID=2664684 RepID=A0A7I8VNE6_9ANNE|nr:DgyrCDS6507 [Dimorphilus gyrociliatus]